MTPHRGPEVRQWICSGCHSPRYVREQFANGKRQLNIADLKLTEGETLIASAVEVAPDTLSELRKNLIQHRQNVLLGIGHQSPDYQWWHGQPALDGDLIQIRDALTRPKLKKDTHYLLPKISKPVRVFAATEDRIPWGGFFVINLEK
jgi:hypothetical protein